MGWEDTIKPIAPQESPTENSDWEKTIVPITKDSPEANSWESTIRPIAPSSSEEPKPGILSRVGSSLVSGVEAIGEAEQYVQEHPKEVLAKVGSWTESTPKVALGSIQRNISGLATLPTDIAAGDAYLTAKMYDSLGLTKAAENIRKSQANYIGASDSIESAIKDASPDYVNNLTPGETTAANIGSLVTGEAAGAKAGLKMLSKGASLGERAAAGLAAGAVGTAATSPGSAAMEPIVLGDKSTDSRVKARLLNPAENLAIGAGIVSAPAIAKATTKAASEAVSKVGDMLLASSPKRVIQEAPEAADTVRQVLISKYQAEDGLGATEAAAKADAELSGTNPAGTQDNAVGASKDDLDAIDPTLGRAAKVYSSLIDRTHQFRHIEGALDNITPGARENYPQTSKIMLAINRQDSSVATVANKGIGIETADGGIELLKKSDIGITGPKADEAIPGLSQLNQKIAEAGGNVEDTYRYMLYRRAQHDAAIEEADNMARDAAIIQARNAVVDAHEGLKAASTESTVSGITEYQARTKALNEANAGLREAEAMPVRRVGIPLPRDMVNQYVAAVADKPWAKVAEEEGGAFLDGLLELAQRSGLKSTEDVANIRAFYPRGTYFPGYREEGEILGSSKLAPKSAKEKAAYEAKGWLGKRAADLIDKLPSDRSYSSIANATGGTSKGAGILEAKGGKEAYADPVDNMMKYVATVTAASQRNIVLNHMVDLLDRLPEESWRELFHSTKADFHQQVLGTKGLQEAVAEGSLDLGTAAEKAQTVLTKDIPLEVPEIKEGVMTFYRDGKKVSLSVKDPSLAKTLDSLVPTKDGAIMETLSKLKNFERAVITLNPAFTVANALRDAQYTGISGKTGGKAGLLTAEGLVRMRKEPEQYAKYLMDTGGGTGYLELGKARNQREVDALVAKMRGEYKRDSWLGIPYGEAYQRIEEANKLQKAYELVEKANTAIENAPRFAEWQRTLDLGGTRAQAAVRAGELTVNFANRGSSRTLGQINKIGLFVNASLQGMDNIARRLRYYPKETIKQASLHLTVPAIMYYGAVTQWPHYDDIPAVVRHTNWIIPYGMRPNDYLKIPMDREISPIFVGVPMAIMDDIRHGTNGAETIQQMVNAVKPLLGFPSGAPPLAQTLYDIKTNKSSLSGAPIESAKFELGTPDKEKYTERTSPTYRALGLATGASPIMLEYGMSQTFGFINDVITGMVTDPIAKKVLGIPDGPTKDLGDYDLIHRFFGTKSMAATGDVYSMANNMRDGLDDLHKYEAIVKGSQAPIDKGQLERAKEFFQDRPKVRLLYSLNAYMDSMNITGKKIQETTGNYRLSPDEKAKKIANLYESRDATAKKFLTKVQKDPEMRQYYGQKYTGSMGITPYISKYLVGSAKDWKGPVDTLRELVKKPKENIGAKAAMELQKKEP